MAGEFTLNRHRNRSIGCFGFLLAAPFLLASRGWVWLVAAPAWHAYGTCRQGWVPWSDKTTSLYCAGYFMLGACLFTRLLSRNGGVGQLLRLVALAGYAYLWTTPHSKWCGALCYIPVIALIVLMASPAALRRTLRMRPEVFDMNQAD